MSDASPNYQSARFPEPRAFQSAAHDALRQGVRAGHRCQLLMSPTGSGKCLGYGTPVLMADGSIRPVQDIAAGDALMGPDGKPRNVLSVATGREMLYRVIPTKGDPYVVNASHILSLRKTPGSDGLALADGSRVGRDDDVVNVNVVAFARSNMTTRHCLKGWRAPAIEQFLRDHDEDAEERFMPSYILGAWLGDGTQGHAMLSKPPCRMVDAWEAYGRSVGYAMRNVAVDGSCPQWHLTNGKDGHSFNVVLSTLEMLGVARSRHVPACYKFGPLEVRRAVLAGLIDSDGHITNGGCDWISKSEQLAQDFAFLCRSVGLACYVSRQRKTIAGTGFEGWYWRASVSGDLSELPMLDKVAPPRQQKKRHLVHGISVEPMELGDYYGFEIDGDRLFLLGDFTVTHNTYLGLRIAHEALAKGRRAVFVCDRTTLIDQTSATADRYGLSAHGIIQANHWRTDYAKPFQIASAQTLARREWPMVDVVIIDEAHTQLKAWTEFISKTEAVVIGLSATPFSSGLGKLFSNLVNATTMEELTKLGVLVPMRVLSCTTANMEGAETSGGEWTDGAAAARGMEIIGDVVSEWTKFGEGRKTIVFGATIAHCEELCRQFNHAGVMAAVFTAETTPAERLELLKEYRKPDSQLRVLISVEALAKGFDVPDVSCVVDCRPLRKSLSTAIQMWGRGLRSSPETGKKDCILLDHSGNIVRFKDDFEGIYFNGLTELDCGEKLDKAIRKEPEDGEKKGCPACGFKPFAKRCMGCGFEIVKESGVEQLPGHMREVMIGKARAAENHEHLWQQVCSYARAHGNPQTMQGRASHIFKDIVGTFPPRGWHIERTAGVEISKAVLNKIRAKNIAFAAAQQKAREHAAANGGGDKPR